MRPLSRSGRLALGLTVIVTASVGLLGPFPRAIAAPAVQSSSRYYIDCHAPQDGDGTSRRPWNSLTAVSLHGDFSPGDHILLRRGSTCRERLSPSGSGSPGRPIVIGAWGTGAKPTVAAGGSASWTGTVQLVDQQYWTVQDLHVTNTSGGRSTRFYRSGLLILNQTSRHLAGITVQRLDVDSVTSNMSNVDAGPRSFGGISILTAGGVTGGFNNAVVRDNVVQRVGRTGIIVSNNSYPNGSDVGTRITGNRVSRTRGDGIVLLGTRVGRMDHNVSADAAQEWPCPECGPISRYTADAAIWTGYSDRVRIDHNEAYGTKAPGGDGEGFDVDSLSTNALIEDNYAHDNEGGGILFCGSKNAVARFNILQNNGKSAFAFIGTARAQNSTIMNNTVYAGARPRARPVRFFNGAFPTRIVFKNNLVINRSVGDWAWPAAPEASGNLLVGRKGRGRPTHGTLTRRTSGLTAPGTGTNAVASLGGYKPKHPSSFPKGVAISKSVTRDFFGKKINPKKPPRGAAG